jgi:2,5-diketo-D-gluconate reductase A
MNNLPKIGFGTGRISRKNIEKILSIALKNNYKLIDTGDAYNNEDLIGNCINKYNKNEIKIITKYFGGKSFGKKNDLTNSFLKSLKNLKKDYIDIYLIHLPGGCTFLKNKGWCYLYDDKTNHTSRINCWIELIELKKRGFVKYIGVSNWNYEQLIEIEKLGLPDVIEIEWCPCYRDFELYYFCKKNNITIIGYGNIKRILNFTKYKGSIDDFNNTKNILINIGKKYNKSITEIVLTWCKQLNVITIPSSTNKNHIKSNIKNYDSFYKLDEEDMESINNIKQVIKGHSLNNIV